MAAPESATAAHAPCRRRSGSSAASADEAARRVSHQLKAALHSSNEVVAQQLRSRASLGGRPHASPPMALPSHREEPGGGGFGGGGGGEGALCALDAAAAAGGAKDTAAGVGVLYAVCAELISSEARYLHNLRTLCALSDAAGLRALAPPQLQARAARPHPPAVLARPSQQRR
jgi:hypothetical protein